MPSTKVSAQLIEGLTDAIDARILVVPSGGGALNLISSASVATQTVVTADGATLITNLVAGITTNGRPVEISFQGFNAGTSEISIFSTGEVAQAQIRIYRDAVQIANYGLFIRGTNGGTNVFQRIPSSSVSFKDIGLAAGTYNYTADVIISTANSTIILQNVRLVLHEIK